MSTRGVRHTDRASFGAHLSRERIKNNGHLGYDLMKETDRQTYNLTCPLNHVFMSPESLR